nr:MAG TPA: hypothetical protein [Caudoviricetes sp.]
MTVKVYRLFYFRKANSSLCYNAGKLSLSGPNNPALHLRCRAFLVKGHKRGILFDTL